MNEQIDPQRIVRLLGFALRHQPLRFGVALDDEGFAGLDELVVGIQFSHYDWATLDRHQVEAENAAALSTGTRPDGTDLLGAG